MPFPLRSIITPDDYEAMARLRSRILGESVTAGQGATLLVTDVEDRDSASVAWAERRGYMIHAHGYTSWLDLAAFDPAPFAGVVDAVRAGSIRFFTLADDPSDGLKQQLYQLYAETMVDIPGYEAEGFMAYETWHKMLAELGGTRPDWVFIAADGDRPDVDRQRLPQRPHAGGQPEAGLCGGGGRLHHGQTVGRMRRQGRAFWPALDCGVSARDGHPPPAASSRRRGR